MRSNRLAVLANEIRAAHEAVEIAQQAAVGKAREAGSKLNEAKELVGYGNWLQWVEALGISRQTTAAYMRLAALNDEDVQRVVHLSLREALRAIAVPHDDPDDPPQWTDDELDRKSRVEQGECIVANLHGDKALIAWAQNANLFVRIDRTTDWGNPFEMPQDGERAEVIGKFEKFYLPHKDGLLGRVQELRGKVLGCWCYPEDCHGSVIAELVNTNASTGEDAWQLAEALADQDG